MNRRKHRENLGLISLFQVFLVLFFGGVSLAGDSVAIQEYRLPAVADAFVGDSHLLTWDGRERKEERYVNFGDNEGLSVVLGRMAGAGWFTNWRGTLIRFDLSEIPRGAEILEARLFLYHYSVWSQPISIHRMTRDWKELEATWFEPCGGCVEWWRGWQDTANGEKNYLNQATDTQWVTEVDQWFSWNVTEDAKQFLGGTPNYGWFLKSAQAIGTDTTSASFYSRNMHREDLRPYLLVKYRPTPPVLTVEITSPADRTTVYATPVDVKGTVSDPSASVDVNGIAASLAGNTFQAKVPLTEGSNALTAVAKDSYGQTASKSVTVNLVTKGRIAGTVTDQSTNLPLALVGVSVTDSSNTSHTVTTGEDGKYVIAGVAFGPFTGSMAREGYTSYPFSGTLDPGQSLTVDGALSPILPVITNVAVNDVTTGSATITWTTDQPSDSLVEYGTAPSYGSSVGDSTLATSHRAALTGLPSNTTYHFRVVSTNAYGFSTSSQDLTFSTLPPPAAVTVTITYPRDGETIHKTDTRVEGTVMNSSGVETGVVVNGVAANRYGNTFTTNHVPLAEGINKLTAVATDAIGNGSAASVSVTSVASDGYVRLISDTESGISPVEALLRVDSTLDLTNSQLAYTGPGDIEFLSAAQTEYRIRMTAVGTYVFTVNVTGPDGTLYQDGTSITVFSRDEVDQMLREKWDGMKQALLGRDVVRALSYFTQDGRDLYSEIFAALQNRLAEIAGAMQEIGLIYVDGNVAKYRIRRNEIFGGQPHSITYYIYFIIDKDGLWRIHKF